MSIESKYSFLNGAIAGAGIMLSIMSIAFLQATGPLEGKMGFTTIEIRIAIFLGFIVFTVSLLYEIYRKKDRDKQHRVEDSFKQSLNQKDNTG
ncbi:MAG: hypothetical protein FJ360_02585 [Thaumarchaeota archaeon]|nr:hypothetical protein [Nitrososphaerota archaeon]